MKLRVYTTESGLVGTYLSCEVVRQSAETGVTALDTDCHINRSKVCFAAIDCHVKKTSPKQSMEGEAAKIVLSTALKLPGIKYAGYF